MTNDVATVVVIGAGYVGLPLAVEIANAGHTTLVLDTDRDKVDEINYGRSYIPGVDLSAGSGMVQASTDPAILADADAIIICVPTPLSKTRDPDNSYIIAALDTVVAHMRAPCLVVLESTTFPGFTREVLVPKLEAAGFVLDRDVFVAFSPERTDPGNKTYGVRNTPKVLGGASPASMTMAIKLYATFVDYVVPMSSTDAAEMVKLLENTFRAVNIGLVNETALMCHRLGLNVWEVIRAAATKPYGFMPFYPGPGLGGHCIPVDPLYLAWKLKTLHYTSRFIALADEVNREMPAFVVSRVAEVLNARRKPLNGSKVLLMGVAYKPDVDDVRESPALTILELLRKQHAHVRYYDHRVFQFAGMTSVEFDAVAEYDCVVIVTAHTDVDYAYLAEHAQAIVDCQDVARGPRTVTL
jgi:UDP-N-acetyl-D-glucosamine dehydrogenase